MAFESCAIFPNNALRTGPAVDDSGNFDSIEAVMLRPSMNRKMNVVFLIKHSPSNYAVFHVDQTDLINKAQVLCLVMRPRF